MSDPNAPRSMSPFWWLLVLPVAGAIGWYVGQVQTPAKPAAPVAAAPVATLPPTAAAEADRLAPPAAEPSPGPATGPRAELSRWTDLQSAFEESKRTGKPILLDFNAEWCGPCQRMKREVFDNGDFGPAVQMAVIPVSIVDRRQEDGHNTPDVDGLQQRFDVDAFPTLVVFSPATGRAAKSRGYQGAAQTVEWVRNVAQSVR